MILDEIVAHKKKEIEQLRLTLKPKDLEPLLADLPPIRNFPSALKNKKTALIAEIKRKSPSAGEIKSELDIYSLAKLYEESGAAAISVLTDQKYFGGSIEDLKKVKEITTIPILRKDFIVDESQVYESRIAGADAILLIVRILQEDQLKKLYHLAKKLGLACLVEAHNEKEIQIALDIGFEIIGINNRDLDSLTIDLNVSLAIKKNFRQLNDLTVVSESGIRSKEDIQKLEKTGIHAFLIGESLLKSEDIGQTMRELIKHV